MNQLKTIFLANYLNNIFFNQINSIYVKNNIVICNINAKFLKVFSLFLKQNFNTQFTQLLDVWGIDLLEVKKRFVVNYLFLSVVYNMRVIVKVHLLENEGIDSLTYLYNSTGWLEREVWDMYGIFFYNHFDLRRILTDYGFDGFPLRKDFPVTGFTEVNYDYEKKRILYTPISLTQEMRTYIYKNPWLG